MPLYPCITEFLGKISLEKFLRVLDYVQRYNLFVFDYDYFCHIFHGDHFAESTEGKYFLGTFLVLYFVIFNIILNLILNIIFDLVFNAIFNVIFDWIKIKFTNEWNVMYMACPSTYPVCKHHRIRHYDNYCS